MRNRFILITAILIGLLAAFLVYNYINGAKQAIENRVYTPVVTAIVDIPANTTITDTMVALKPFPTELRSNREFLNVSDVVGKIASADLVKGEVLLDIRLVKPGESVARLSYKVPSGMRAITVSVDPISGLASMIKIGDHVDLIGVVAPGNQSNESRATVLLQNIEVIAINSNLQEKGGAEAGEAASITLAVDPQSALRVKMAIDSTKYAFTLRSAGDKSYPATTPVSLGQL